MKNILGEDKFIKIREGLAILWVPDPDVYRNESGYFDPAWAPVFYNPRMRVSRDLSSIVISVYSEKFSRKNLTILDALGATGVRGIRYALENRQVVKKVVINDINDKAFFLIKNNIALNGLESLVEARHEDAISLMNSERGFDVVDIDPFGSPAPFTESALRSVNHGGLVCITATDLPPLLGKYPKTCIRKYFSLSVKTDFSKELGLRILMYFIAREAAKIGKTIMPLFSYYSEHHYRICAQVFSTKTNYSMLPSNIGFMYYCPKCLDRNITYGIIPTLPTKCRTCGHSRLLYGGPLWTGDLYSREFTDLMYKKYKKLIKDHVLSKKGLKIIEKILSEIAIPFYYTLDSIATSYGINCEPSIKLVINGLRKKGWKASPTHFDPKGFKTDAPIREIVGCLKELKPC